MKDGDRLNKELAQREADERIRADLLTTLRRKWEFCDCGLNLRHPLHTSEHYGGN